MNAPPKIPSPEPTADEPELDEDEDTGLEGFLMNASPEERKRVLADLEGAEFLLMPGPPWKM